MNGLDQHEIRDLVETQAQEIAASLVSSEVYIPTKPELKGDELRNHLAKSEIVAVIAYIQKLGAYRVVESDTPGKPILLDPDTYRKVTAE